jgi:hypothetical protein
LAGFEVTLYGRIWVTPEAHYGKLRRNLGEVFHQLAKQKECWIEEGHLMSDHVAHDDRDTAEVCGVPG